MLTMGLSTTNTVTHNTRPVARARAAAETPASGWFIVVYKYAWGVMVLAGLLARAETMPPAEIPRPQALRGSFPLHHPQARRQSCKCIATADSAVRAGFREWTRKTLPQYNRPIVSEQK